MTDRGRVEGGSGSSRTWVRHRSVRQWTAVDCHRHGSDFDALDHTTLNSCSTTTSYPSHRHSPDLPYTHQQHRHHLHRQTHQSRSSEGATSPSQVRVWSPQSLGNATVVNTVSRPCLNLLSGAPRSSLQKQLGENC